MTIISIPAQHVALLGLRVAAGTCARRSPGPVLPRFGHFQAAIDK